MASDDVGIEPTNCKQRDSQYHFQPRVCQQIMSPGMSHRSSAPPPTPPVFTYACIHSITYCGIRVQCEHKIRGKGYRVTGAGLQFLIFVGAKELRDQILS
jgi:hypothetical protein